MRCFIVCLFLIVSPAMAMAECSQAYEMDVAEIAGIPYQETKRFDAHGLGVQFRYYEPDGSRNVSYYRYDSDQDVIDDTMALAEIQGVHAVVLQVSEMNGLEIGSVEQIDAFMAGDVEILNIMYVGVSGAQAVTEFAGLGHDGQCFHKVRYTQFIAMDAADVDAARAQYFSVLEGLAPHIATPLP